MSIFHDNGDLKPQFVLTSGRAMASDNPKKRSFSDLNDREKLQRVSKSLATIGKMLGQQRHALYGAIQNAAIHGHWLKSSPTNWTAFCELSGWSGVDGRPRTQDIGDAIRFVLKWRCGLDDDGNKAASFYNRAVGPYLANGGDPRRLRRHIKASGGLSRLAKVGQDELPPPYPEDGTEAADVPTAPTATEDVGRGKRGNTPSIPQGNGNGNGQSPMLGFDFELTPAQEKNLRETKAPPRLMVLRVSLTKTPAKGRIKGKLLSFADDNPAPEE